MAQFVVLAMTATSAASAENALTEAMDPAAQSLVGTLNEVARRESAPLEVAVRPARMELDGLFVRCSALGKDLRDRLRERLEHWRRKMRLDHLQVRAVDVDVEAVVEVNTEWTLDERDGADVMVAVVRAVVRAKEVGLRIVGGSEMSLEAVRAADLSQRQQRCLMRWKDDERTDTVPEGRRATVREEPGLRGKVLRTYMPGDEVHVVGDLQPLGDDQRSWQVVRVEDNDYGFARMSWFRSSAEPVVKPVPPEPDPIDKEFQDCDVCPQMVVVPAGGYLMGSPDKEEGRAEDEGPQHEVRIAAPFALGKYEVTFAEWEACERAGGCPQGDMAVDDDGWGRGRRPVIRVNWQEAQRYVGWLSEKTGQSYRLPSESEWEYAARAGTSSSQYWGGGDQCRHANGADASLKADGGWRWSAASCDDGHVHTAPVGSFAANDWGLHDTLGNVWEWTEDCWNGNYDDAPRDGSSWQDGNCGWRVLRGGSWSLVPSILRAAYRSRATTGYRNVNVGFRVARTCRKEGC